MDVAALLLELYGRIPPLVRQAVDGLDAKRLTEIPAPGANSIAWLVWHLTRVQDHHRVRAARGGAALGRRRVGRNVAQAVRPSRGRP